ncbi:MAG: signal peptidase II [Myxococcota bacterium]
MTTKLKILVFLTSALVVLDQLTKLWTVRALRYSGPPLPGESPFSLQGPMEGLKAWGHSSGSPEEIAVVPGFLSFIHAQNPGAAMGLAVGFEWRLPMFYGFTIVATWVLLKMYRELEPGDRFQSVTIALILSGALGNLIDRVHKSTVTDFIKVYTEYAPLKAWLVSTFRTNEWPTFNVADAAIVVGVALYLVHYLFFEKDKADAAGDAGRSPLEEGA